MTQRGLDEQSVREMNDEEIKRLFDNLVEAWEDLNGARQELDEFQQKHSSPEPPAPIIESVESLIEYNRQKWRYEQRLQERENRYEEREVAFDALAEAVRYILPENHRLNHAYRWNRYELQGAEYTIRHQRGFGEQRGESVAPTSNIVVERRR